MTALKALLWDVDGTIAETERDGHRVAFNEAFAAFGLGWRWDDAHYGRLLRITGGRERLLHDMAGRSDAPVLAAERDALAATLHVRKNDIYARLVRDGAIALRPGVLELMRQARDRGLRQGIVTTTSAVNVESLLQVRLGADWRVWFDVVVCGEQVRRKKPDPEAYGIALASLGVDPLEAVALEDSPGGVAAARAAHVPVVVTRSTYFGDAIIEGAVAIGPGLGSCRGWRPTPRAGGDGERAVDLHDLEHWCRQMDLVSQHG